MLRVDNLDLECCYLLSIHLYHVILALELHDKFIVFHVKVSPRQFSINKTSLRLIVLLAQLVKLLEQIVFLFPEITQLLAVLF